MQSIRSLLQKVDLFNELTEEELEPIVQIAQKRQYRKKMIVFMQGDPLDRVFFIYSGKVKIYRTDLTGREQIISILQTGDMFPHTGFFRQGAYPAHAEILEETTLIVILIHDFEQLLIDHPKLCIKLFRVMGERILDLQNRLEEQVLHNTYEQIIMLLLRLSKQYGRDQANGYTRLNIQFTNRELANMIGSSRETISRTLAQLRKEKMVDLDAEGHFLIDTEKLKQALSFM
ncbi:Crp/Fnr family transcriptional regulator [Bacillaceae bacterium]